MVGYLSGSGGAGTWSAAEAQAEWRAEIGALRGRIEGLLEEVIALEEGFEQVKWALDRTQPRMFNRVTVSWWRLRGGDRKTPVLVRVEGGPNGTEKPVRVTTAGIKLRTDRGFGLCADLAKRAVVSYWRLWKLRQEVSDELGRLGTALGRRPDKRRERVGLVVAEATEVRREAEERLREIGYDVPELAIDAAGAEGRKAG